MGKTTSLRRAIDTSFVPLAAERGFTVSRKALPLFLRFQRPSGAAVHLFEIQWEKYGRPRFIVNYGTCPAEGMVLRGRSCAPGEIAVGWLPDSGRPGRSFGST